MSSEGGPREHEHERELEREREPEREPEREHEHERGREPRRLLPDDEGLSMHRLALRAAVRGATAGLCVAATVFVLFLFEDRGGPGGPLEWFLMWVGAATGCTLLVGADEVSRHAPPRLRLPTATTVGALAAAIIAAAVVWLEAILSGEGFDGGWTAIGRFSGEVLRRPDQFVPGAAALLIVFLALWLSRTIRPGLGGILRRSLVGGAGGLASFLVLCVCWGAPPADKLAYATLVFAMVPAAAVPGLWLGGVVEERLLKALERWRDQQ